MYFSMLNVVFCVTLFKCKSITSVGEKRAVLLLSIAHIFYFSVRGGPLFLGARERLRYFIMALPGSVGRSSCDPNNK